MVDADQVINVIPNKRVYAVAKRFRRDKGYGFQNVCFT